MFGILWVFQKKEKGGMANAKMYTFLEQNIVARTLPCLHKFRHTEIDVCNNLFLKNITI